MEVFQKQWIELVGRGASLTGCSELAWPSKRGTIIVSAKMQKRYGIEEGTVVTTEAREDVRSPGRAVLAPGQDEVV